MKKNSTRKHFPAKRASLWLYWLIGGGCFMLLSATISFFIYQHKSESYKVASNSLHWVKIWIAKYKNPAPKPPANKSFAIKKEEMTPPVHFEFYTTLPHMQLMVEKETDTVQQHHPTIKKKTNTRDKVD